MNRVARKPVPIPTRRKLLFSTILFAVLFGGFELLCRVAWTPPAYKVPVVGERKFVTWLSRLSTTDPLAGPLYREDRNLLWTLMPAVELETVISHRNPEGGEEQAIRIRINQAGYRGRELDAGKDVFRVLCLGDSNFFGYPLDDEHVLPRVLEQVLSKLDPDRTFIVINGGVPGYTISQGRRWYDERFAGENFDVVLLSYLNNDAWLQPQTDAELFAIRESPLYPVARLARRSRLIRFVGSWAHTEVPAREFVQRVPLDDFVQQYESLIGALHEARTHVMVLDYRAHRSYEPYSVRLQELAARHGVPYFNVTRKARSRMIGAEGYGEYRHLGQRVARRWGPMLDERPSLRFYAEVYPEHLNEVGVAWLADQVAPMLLESAR